MTPPELLDPAPEWLGRMLALEDAATVDKIRRSQVLCVGLGGVGGLATEPPPNSSPGWASAR